MTPVELVSTLLLLLLLLLLLFCLQCRLDAKMPGTILLRDKDGFVYFITFNNIQQVTALLKQIFIEWASGCRGLLSSNKYVSRLHIGSSFRACTLSVLCACLF